MTNKMPSAVRDRAVQIANHEMAHYVVARALGFETGGVSLTVTIDLRHRGGAAITLARPIASMEGMKAHLQARLMVLFAGVMGQTLNTGNAGGKRVDKAQALAILRGEFGAEKDYAKIRELLHLLRNIEHPDTNPASSRLLAAELKAINDGLWLRTQNIVEALAETIIELGSRLVEEMALVEQWGRAADTYEGELTREVLERLEVVGDIDRSDTSVRNRR
ncbi:peptidase M41 [Pseudomonas sp. PB3P13]